MQYVSIRTWLLLILYVTMKYCCIFITSTSTITYLISSSSSNSCNKCSINKRCSSKIHVLYMPEYANHGNLTVYILGFYINYPLQQSSMICIYYQFYTIIYSNSNSSSNSCESCSSNTTCSNIRASFIYIPGNANQCNMSLYILGYYKYYMSQ